MSNGYKPSPLGYGTTARSSPFRRPESPASSPSPLRQTTPTKLASKASHATGSTYAVGYGNAVSQLQPAQVRTMREGFQILDRDSDGVVNREDVADMLNQLGLPAHASEVSQFFPPSAHQTMTLAAFLNSISTSLAALSPSSELLSAFSAFDDDDSGQIDLAELRDALLHTAPEPGEKPLTSLEIEKVMSGFAGRRAFSKSKAGSLGKRGEVFRYQDFVNSVIGGNGGADQGSEDSEDA
ncbi:hypothetical protein B0T17DRAFT_589536 [Bombardia bombarda]|uniref:EF-hand domain-containing protein n=1 Tax=Bombardia bombarda TaxID=252184 RepID=A0AA39X9Z3_9PEZI|nr:hypothetical protein B0T17DRAFT_589536 [Bombardia bombarda]